MGSQDLEILLGRITELEGESVRLNKELESYRHMERQMHRAQRMESVAILAAGIAHDFNNILQSILGYTQIGLLDGPEKNSHHRRWKSLEQIARKGAGLTKQLLSLGKEMEPDFVPVDLNGAILGIVEMLRRTIPRMIEIRTDFSGDQAVVCGNPDQLEQVLMNLSINASDAMGEAGVLTFKTEVVEYENGKNCGPEELSPGRYVSLTVSDTGCGIAEATRLRMYDPFFTTKHREKGTGLGLSVVRAIVRNHSGFIDCSTGRGCGTSFRILLPASGAALKSLDSIGNESLQHSETVAAASGSEHILVVDDETSLLDIWGDILAHFGYSVTTAPSGEDALVAVDRLKPDVVILDMNMPGMGGLRCLEKLMRKDPSSRVIISSGYHEDVQVKRALRIGARGFLPKPCTVESLLAEIRRTMDSCGECDHLELDAAAGSV